MLTFQCTFTNVVCVQRIYKTKNNKIVHTIVFIISYDNVLSLYKLFTLCNIKWQFISNSYNIPMTYERSDLICVRHVCTPIPTPVN